MDKPTALAWTAERPSVPGFYWWVDKYSKPRRAQVVELECIGPVDDADAYWFWSAAGQDYSYDKPAGSLWWPERLEPPPCP